MSIRVAALITDNRKLLMIHRWNNGWEYYVLPGGGVEQGESLKQACAREILEETGLKVTIEKKIDTIVNRGRTEHYFRAISQGGRLKIGGPEKERQSEDNKYRLEWIDYEMLKNIPLRPQKAFSMCLSALTE